MHDSQRCFNWYGLYSLMHSIIWKKYILTVYILNDESDGMGNTA